MNKKASYTPHDLSSDNNHPELFRRIAAGDSQAFSAAHELYSARLLYYGKRFLSEWDEVEDVVADAFLTLWQSRMQLQSDAHLKNFLFLIVRNKALNRVHAKARQQQLLDTIDADVMAEAELFDEALVEVELMHLIDQAVQTLPTECRRIFELSWEKEQSPAEIARSLGINPATVRSQKRRAIQLIQAWFRKNGPAALTVMGLLKKIFLFLCTISWFVCINSMLPVII